MRTLKRVYKHGDTAAPSEFTHTPEYQPQPGEVIAVRDGAVSDWLIREFIRHVSGGLLVECKGASSTITYDWHQWSPIPANRLANGKSDVTFKSVVRTLLEVDAVTHVGCSFRGTDFSLRSTDSAATLERVQETIELEQIRITALTKLTPIERKALGL